MLVPERVSRPAPAMVRLPVPEITPESVRPVFVDGVNVPLPVRVTARVEVMSAVVASVPPLKMRPPVDAPRLASAEI